MEEKGRTLEESWTDFRDGMKEHIPEEYMPLMKVSFYTGVVAYVASDNPQAECDAFIEREEAEINSNEDQ